ncbi:MAG TPA: nucleotidyltransferase domain-containing protein, partial [Methanocorpusculum sp.]|nr:nucleotidyltransferase domain-containing protein [Methanocorpusculum sp.]
MRERFFVDIIGIFGSVSRGEDTAESDVDVLYKFSERKGSYDTFLDLADYLENLFQRKVDVVSLTYLSPHVKPYV